MEFERQPVGKQLKPAFRFARAMTYRRCHSGIVRSGKYRFDNGLGRTLSCGEEERKAGLRLMWFQGDLSECQHHFMLR